MRFVPALLLVATLAHGVPATTSYAQTAPAPDPWATSFRPLPFHEIAKAVTDQYQGRLVAAETRPPRPPERALGAELIYQFRLLTPDRNLLNIRVDARTGRFLEVAGRGQLSARRPRQ